MRKTILFSILALAAGASAAEEMGRVLSSTPVVQQIGVPRQVCSSEPVLTAPPKSGAGAVMGAIAGGAMGNAVGNGSGRALATMIGLVGGALVGDRIEGNGQPQVEQMQSCTTQTFYENRTVAYNVVYEYAGKQYTVQMPSDPGPYVRLQVTPVGGSLPPPPPAQVISAPGLVQPYPQPVQPIVSETVVVPAPAVAYPVYEPRPYYRSYPSYPPIGINLNLGYVRHSGGHGYWR